MRRRAFRAMGTNVELLVEADGPGADAALDAAEAEIHRLEALFSRFRDDSELSAVNARRTTRVGPDLARVLGEALDARQRSGGRFDPTVHDAVVAAGYDRDLSEIPADDPRPAAAAAPAGGAVELDLRSGEVALPDGVAIDLGGIAKGDAADRACAILAQAGPALASVGGDLAVSGPRADGTGWPVAVEGAGLVVALTGGGLATSGRDRRVWRRGGREMHHVIDPATGAPSDTDLIRVTAAGPSAARAETLATDLLLLGADAARRRADDLGCPAVLVGATSGTTLAGGLA